MFIISLIHKLLSFYRSEDELKDIEEGMNGLELTIATDDCSLIFSESQLNISDDVNEIINKTVCDEKIKEDVQSCIKDLLDSVKEKVKGKKKLTRKRSINKQNWAASKRKKSNVVGEEYINSRGKKIPAKKTEIKKGCLSNCKFRCSEKIDTKTQDEIFMDFYKLDTTGKHFFISQTSICS